MNSNDKYPKVLLISDAVWSDTNNVGNTLSNLFSNWPKDRLAMIYTRHDLPDTAICNSFFQISENRLIENFFYKNIRPGKKISYDELKNFNGKISMLKKDEIAGEKMYSFFKKHRFNIFLTLRDVLWQIGNWKTEELDTFIGDFKPDVVFLLACPGVYINSLQQYVLKKAACSGAIYFVDDIYSKKQISLSPFFWLNKIFTRKSLMLTVNLCDVIYTIVLKQKKEYDKYFNVNSKVLNKGGDFNLNRSVKEILNYPIKLIYTGNIYAGRWKTLAEIAYALDEININETKALLYVYTKNDLNSKIRKALQSSSSIRFMGGIGISEVKKVQNDADILVHVESLDIKEKYLSRLSFSTKLVDYFECAKCIFAVGSKDSASIDYLIENKAAIVVTDLKKMKPSLKYLINNHQVIIDYGNKAWNCGRNNHCIKKMQSDFYDDLVNISKDGKI